MTTTPNTLTIHTRPVTLRLTPTEAFALQLALDIAWQDHPELVDSLITRLTEARRTATHHT